VALQKNMGQRESKRAMLTQKDTKGIMKNKKTAGRGRGRREENRETKVKKDWQRGVED